MTVSVYVQSIGC